MSAGIIVIRFVDSLAVIDVAHADVVAPMLSYRCHAFRAKHGVVSGQSTRDVLGSIDGNTFRFPAKLFRYVMLNLERKGYSVRLDSPRFGQCSWNLDVLPTLPEPAKSIFTDAGNNFGGLLRSEPGTHPTTLIPHMLRLYPQYRTVLAVRNRDEMDSWLSRLRAADLTQRVCSVRVGRVPKKGCCRTRVVIP